MGKQIYVNFVSHRMSCNDDKGSIVDKLQVKH
jgi:hypothetical protein